MTKLIAAITLAFFSSIAFAQLKGSGNTLTKTYNYTDFDKIDFEDLDGKLEVEIGKPFSITVTIDDNLVPLLAFDQNRPNQLLKIYFKGNHNNNLYIENTKINIKITMPTAVCIMHTSNSVMTVSYVNGSAFRLENNGNAATKISGNIDNLEIKNTGNGNVYAEGLLAKKAVVKCSGNGNVNVNASETINARATGNSSVKNNGNARFDSESSKSGNARLIYK